MFLSRSQGRPYSRPTCGMAVSLRNHKIKDNREIREGLAGGLSLRFQDVLGALSLGRGTLGYPCILMAFGVSWVLLWRMNGGQGRTWGFGFYRH